MNKNGSNPWWRVEWQVLTQAPLSFGFCVVILSLLIGAGFYWKFHTNLELKADKIAFLREENDRLRHEITRMVEANVLRDAPLHEAPDPNKKSPDACRSSLHNPTATMKRLGVGREQSVVTLPKSRESCHL